MVNEKLAIEVPVVMASPFPSSFTISLVRMDGPTVCLEAHGAAAVGHCPACGLPSDQVHERYVRRPLDLPWRGDRVRLQLTVRRFRCRTATCSRGTFAEDFGPALPRYARRTADASAFLLRVAQAAGGEEGARLAAAARLPVSPDTLLRLLQDNAPLAGPTPRVLGVDDWCRRKGRTYGTILVDLEQHRPVDLLPDRTAAALGQWLRAHPGVEIIARDRAGAYADGARQGAPAAIQVADRFHLHVNVGDALERLLRRQEAHLRAVAQAVAETTPTRAVPSPVPEEPASEARPAPRTPTRTEQQAAARRARRQARYDAVVALAQHRCSQRVIAQRLQLSRGTVAKYLRADDCPHPGARRRRHRLVDPYLPYLQERWAAGCRNAQALFRELQARGYAGGRSILSARLAEWRTGPQRPGPYPAGVPGEGPPDLPAATPLRQCSPRQTRWLLLTERTDLAPEQEAYRDRLLAEHPTIAQARTLTVQFCQLVRERDAAGLAPWLASAKDSGLAEFREFAAGIERDRAAVEAALWLDISNGQTEGQITKLKLLKRAMYGRASLALLRARLLRVG
jgi:transposase